MLIFRKSRKPKENTVVDDLVEEEVKPVETPSKDFKQPNRNDVNSPSVKNEIRRLEKDVAIIDALLALGDTDRNLVHRKVRALNQIARLSGRAK